MIVRTSYILWNILQQQKIEAIYINGSECYACPLIFPSNSEAIDHYKSTHLNFRYICDGCSKHCDSRVNFDLHKLSCHAPREKLLSETSQKKRSIMTEFNKNNCYYCKIEFPEKSEIIEHFKMVHGCEVNDICDKCDHGYLSDLALKLHKCKGNTVCSFFHILAFSMFRLSDRNSDLCWKLDRKLFL